MTWIDERVEILRRMWADGFSASLIAAELGYGISRNAVIGKAMRLGLQHRAGWTGPQSSSRLSFAWFVWDRAHKGPTELHRISWDRDDYDAKADIERCFDLAYKTIRERKAAGGKGWPE